jgi:hypothetical protein
MKNGKKEKESVINVDVLVAAGGIINNIRILSSRNTSRLHRKKINRKYNYQKIRSAQPEQSLNRLI